MKKPEFITVKQAVDRIKSGTTICTIGMTLISACESILKELETDSWKQDSQINLHMYILVDSRIEKPVLFIVWLMKD